MISARDREAVNTQNQRSVIIADSDEEAGQIIARTLESRFTLRLKTFTSGDQCLKSIYHNSCDLLITGTSTCGMDGITLLERAKKVLPPLTVVVVISDVSDVRIAVYAMKRGAFDILVKPFDPDKFLRIIECALASRVDVSASELQSLTQTEHAVLKLILKSTSTKEIARIRSRSTRTIEGHRQSIMHKLGALDSIDLVKRIGFVSFPQYYIGE